MTKITPPRLVLGYNPQCNDTIDRVNENKVLEELVLRQLDKMMEQGEVDARWVAIARTHIQEGFMAANRAIFKPGRVQGKLDGDFLFKLPSN